MRWWIIKTSQQKWSAWQYMVIYDDDCVRLRDFYMIFLDSPIANLLIPRLTLVTSLSTFHLSRRPCVQVFVLLLMYQSQLVHGSKITLFERGGKIFPDPENKSMTYGHIFSTLDFCLLLIFLSLPKGSWFFLGHHINIWKNDATTVIIIKLKNIHD